jgi:plasmid stabilization system protein ParE
MQIDKVLAYIARDSPLGASRVSDHIREIAILLSRHPLAGHGTNRRGVRRIMISPYPYFLFYRVEKNEIIIQRFRHAARDPKRAPGRA